MQYYGSLQLAESFRTVRKNTVQIAEDIPAESYEFRPAEGTRSVGETLAHMAVMPGFARKMNAERVAEPTIEWFQEAMRETKEREAALRAKHEIVEFLKEDGEKYAAWLSTLPEEELGETVTLPAGAEPPSRTRFDLLLGIKEHEMHHRGQLMLIERMLGIVPHLTRKYQERAAAFEAARKDKLQPA